jgi:hypothetical protein
MTDADVRIMIFRRKNKLNYIPDPEPLCHLPRQPPSNRRYSAIKTPSSSTAPPVVTSCVTSALRMARPSLWYPVYEHVLAALRKHNLLRSPRQRDETKRNGRSGGEASLVGPQSATNFRGGTGCLRSEELAANLALFPSHFC